MEYQVNHSQCRSHASWWSRWGILLTAGSVLYVTSAVAQQDELPPPAPEEVNAEVGADVEVLTRGPLHESFATAFTKDAVEFPVIKQQPPEPIKETPPDYKPVGRNVMWIPGYWYYDDDQNDFLWISGYWRNVPPGRQWVPGYWAEVDGGYQWRPGMWARAGAEVGYLPPPPESREAGPSSPQPSPEHFYVPGYWVYEDGDYQWRPGFWARHQRGWVWVPARYNRVGNRVVFVDGYWDYRLAGRGQLFAPVRFRSSGNAGTRIAFTPRAIWSTGAPLLLHLFVNPRTGLYVYGDYYGDANGNRFRPWFRYAEQHRDPLLGYYQWTSNGQFVDNVQRWFDFFTRHPDYRPRATLAEQLDFIRSNRAVDYVDQMVTGNLLSRVVRSGTGQRFEQLANDVRDQIVGAVETTRQVLDQRLSVESNTAADGRVDSVLRLPQIPFLSEGTTVRGSGRVEGKARGRVTSPDLPEVRVPTEGLPVPTIDPDIEVPSGGLEIPQLPVEVPGLPF
ncbi:MAG: hypothetical protein KatS3mg111_3775 [Pirellulaceae bacterium]|nr:MAG: hypothetical protein KatS3mg111_3775 [Pirellulaceae bacterium]